MNWDEQLIKACTETDGTPHPRTDHVLSGAKWQREQLRTNEAIERVARAVWEESYTREKDRFEDERKSTRGYYKVRAARLITALLGDNQCHP